MCPCSSSVTLGFLWPGVVFDQIRRVDVSAKSLDKDIAANVADAEFRGNWAAWFTEWRAFAEKYESTTNKATALLGSEELKAQVDAYETQLGGWRARYSKQRGGGGGGLDPSMPDDGGKSKPWPWLTIALVGAGVLVVGGVAFSVYHAGKGATRRARQGEELLDAYLGARL
jgi:hypothetical protein